MPYTKKHHSHLNSYTLYSNPIYIKINMLFLSKKLPHLPKSPTLNPSLSLWPVPKTHRQLIKHPPNTLKNRPITFNTGPRTLILGK